MCIYKLGSSLPAAAAAGVVSGLPCGCVCVQPLCVSARAGNDGAVGGFGLLGEGVGGWGRGVVCAVLPWC